MPDLRGLFLRGHGSQTHTQIIGADSEETETVHSSETLQTVQGDAFRVTGAKGNFQIKTSRGGFFAGFRGEGCFKVIEGMGMPIESTGYGTSGKGIEFDMSNSLPTSNEIRPVNMAVRYLIRALP